MSKYDKGKRALPKVVTLSPIKASPPPQEGKQPKCSGDPSNGRSLSPNRAGHPSSIEDDNEKWESKVADHDQLDQLTAKFKEKLSLSSEQNGPKSQANRARLERHEIMKMQSNYDSQIAEAKANLDELSLPSSQQPGSELPLDDRQILESHGMIGGEKTDSSSLELHLEQCKQYAEDKLEIEDKHDRSRDDEDVIVEKNKTYEAVVSGDSEIDVGQLSQYDDDRLFYRVTRPDELGDRIFPKDKNQKRTVESHVGCGSRQNYKSQFISVTTSYKVSKKYYKESLPGTRIVGIYFKDIKDRYQNFFDLTIDRDRNLLLKSPRNNNFAKASSEVLFDLKPETDGIPCHTIRGPKAE